MQAEAQSNQVVRPPQHEVCGADNPHCNHGSEIFKRRKRQGFVATAKLSRTLKRLAVSCSRVVSVVFHTFKSALASALQVTLVACKFLAAEAVRKPFSRP